MKLGLFCFTLFGMSLIFSCGSSDQKEETPADITPVDEADRSRYNINEDTESVISLDSTQVDSTLINQNP